MDTVSLGAKAAEAQNVHTYALQNEGKEIKDKKQ